MSNKRFSILVLVFALVGFLDATYLSIKHYTGGTLPCSILDGCDTVTTSAYASFGPVPVALLGALFYLSVIVLAILRLQNQDSAKPLNLIFWLSSLAFLASLWFVYLQFFVIKALCLYCLISATTSTLIFLLALWWRRRARREVLAS